MGIIIDLYHRQFNRLFVLRQSLRRGGNGGVYWKCLCNCGNIITVRCDHLIKKDVKSCGCLNYVHGNNLRKSGRSKLYNIWRGMKERCSNKNSYGYKNYGGRGITYDLKWETFLGFKENMYFKYIYYKRKYGKNCKLSIERMNVNGNYCFENCIFIPLRDQWINRREK